RALPPLTPPDRWRMTFWKVSKFGRNSNIPSPESEKMPPQTGIPASENQGIVLECSLIIDPLYFAVN
ncbi:MAG: hypothetical protein K8I03_05915, partial [Ignavibacteria bacterium]|nr:hypothetical protein [Ignavibacteria bacterium]